MCHTFVSNGVGLTQFKVFLLRWRIFMQHNHYGQLYWSFSQISAESGWCGLAWNVSVLMYIDTNMSAANCARLPVIASTGPLKQKASLCNPMLFKSP